LFFQHAPVADGILLVALSYDSGPHEGQDTRCRPALAAKHGTVFIDEILMQAHRLRTAADHRAYVVQIVLHLLPSARTKSMIAGIVASPPPTIAMLRIRLSLMASPLA
jgi:hypothetical protein